MFDYSYAEILIIWAATVLGLGVATLITPGIETTRLSTFLVAATVLGLINVFIRPVLWLLTAPLTVFTFGLFALVINALMIMLAAALVPGFKVRGFWSAFLAAVIMAIIGVLAIVAFALFSDVEISWQSYQVQSYR